MSNKINSFFCFSLLISALFLSTAFSQNNFNKNGHNGSGKGIITGSVTESDNGKPMVKANVRLIAARDSSIVGGALTDVQGVFTINKVADGKYYIRVSTVGYKAKIIKDVIISESNLRSDLGKIVLEQNAVSTKGVEVTAQKEMMEYNIDRKVIHVDKSIASLGATAVDIMQTVPSINVDVDGNISMRGSDNIKILIDGKPSGLSAASLLQQIPASAIETIEIITNPSAKFDAEGTAGVINIIMKKREDYGFNGMMTFNAGTGDKYNGSVNLNYRQENYNIFVNYDVRYFSMTGHNFMNTNYFQITDPAFMNQNEDFLHHGYWHNFKTGVDYYLNPFDILSLSVLYNNGTWAGSEDITNTNLNISRNLTGLRFTGNDEDNPNHGMDYTLTYRHNFGKKMNDLTADLFYSTSDWNGKTDVNIFDSIPALTEQLQKISSISNTRTIMFQSDYTLPLNEGAKFESGVKASLRKSDANNGLQVYNNQTLLWQDSTALSDHFIYNENIDAAYATYSDKLLWGLQYQAGLRAEMTYFNFTQDITGESYEKKPYVSFFPSIFLKQPISTSQSIQISYSRRISRPNSRQLNPFVDREDPYNLRAGNPKLNPEFINSYELGHSLNLEKTSLNSTLFYRQNNGSITRVRTLVDSIIGYTTFINLATNNSYGIELAGTQEIMKGWRFDASYSYFRTMIKGNYNNINLNTDDYSWSAKFNTYLTLWDKVDVQLLTNYKAPINTAQGKIEAVYFADLGIKIGILDGNGSINLRLSDIFNTMRFNSQTYSIDYNLTAERKRVSRIAFLGFSYKFNNFKRTMDRRRQEEGSGGGFDEGD